jgi:hypothetical protein
MMVVEAGTRRRQAPTIALDETQRDEAQAAASLIIWEAVELSNREIVLDWGLQVWIFNCDLSNSALHQSSEFPGQAYGRR